MTIDQYSDKKIVWVLGSGFSVPLGGPTLNDLLSQKLKNAIQFIFPKDTNFTLYHRNYLDLSYELYKKGISILDFQAWNNAEDFLDYLDTASSSDKNIARSMISSVMKEVKPGFNDFSGLATTTRRIIAAECSAFLQNKSTDLEEWQPYIQWAKLLSSKNTVLTFNYDLVLEMLALLDGIPNINLSSFYGTQNNKLYSKESLITIAIKLHGSVNWKIERSTTKLSEEKFTIKISKDLESLNCDADKILIATPGPTKHEMVSDIFLPLWDKAAESLRNAEAVVFMGYRFPPSDANARDKLLGALMQNESDDLRIFTVLGPDDNADNRRLEALLKYATSRKPKGKATVTRLPLWAQDFMSLYTPEMLFE